MLHLYHPIAESPDQVQRAHLCARRAGIPVAGDSDTRTHGPERVRRTAIPYPAPTGDAWIHDFATRRSIGPETVSAKVRSLFGDAFSRVWKGDIDDDGFNGLVLRAGLSWKEAMLFRAYSRYQHQIKVPYTQAYTIAVLNRHPDVVRKLNRLFHLRFCPGMD